MKAVRRLFRGTGISVDAKFLAKFVTTLFNW